MDEKLTSSICVCSNKTGIYYNQHTTFETLLLHTEFSDFYEGVYKLIRIY